MTGISSHPLWIRSLALLACLGLAASVHAAEKTRNWGGGPDGWTGWTASGGWTQHSAGRAGNPQPNQPHWESQEETTGTLRSPIMTVEENYLQFWVNGWDGEGVKQGKNHYYLRLAKDGSIVREMAPPQGDGMSACNWIVSDLKGQQVYFEAVDGLAGKTYAWLGLAQVVGVSIDNSDGKSPYRALTPPALFKAPELSVANRGGIPFIYANRPSLFEEKGPVRLEVGCKAKNLFLLGMTTTPDQGCNGWNLNPAIIFFLGDQVGRIRVGYSDGVSEDYPLIMGENVWWGARFFEYPEPFASVPAAQKVLEKTLRLYPAQPQADGRYLAVIKPRPVAVQYIELLDSEAKLGVPVLSAVTVEVAGTEAPAHSEPLSASPLKADLQGFIKQRTMRRAGQEARIQKDLEDLRGVMYATPDNFPKHVPLDVPAAYQGPRVQFKGDAYAEVLTNMFYHNVQDIRDKVDQEGVYHTSTKDAPTWGYYQGFGTFKKKLGQYYYQYWSRDMGRSMQELAALGFLDEPRRNAEWAFKEARVWSSGRPDLKLNGHELPPHWCRTLNMPDLNTEGPLTGCFENDGHGLTAMEVYQVWRHMPDGNAWAKAHWADIQAAGDWVLWQFAHPELSKATDVLWTQSECAGGQGHTIYADFACMEALHGLAEMADAVGQPEKAKAWRERAELMKKGMERNYVEQDPKTGAKTWTFKSAGWPHKSTPLGPVIMLADRRGLDPREDNPTWRAITEATYQQLINEYKPLGNYGAAMGYGQGFYSQAALLFDRMQDATTMMQWAARETYNPYYASYIVPEGCISDPNGKYMFRMADIGNGVQEAEIVKSMRVVIGVDDMKPERLRLLPRMPYGWSEISIDRYPALMRREGKTQPALLRYTLRRDAKGAMTFDLTADQPLPAGEVRLGPFKKAPTAKGITLNGQPVRATVEQSGDSFWTRVPVPEGAAKIKISAGY